LPIGTNISFITKVKNEIDLFGRTLAYVITSDGTCINEKLISNGYAKPYDKFYSTKLSSYQQLNFNARTQNKGIYSIVSSF
jgi:endonuclease YncB( thermonuclease family)